MANALLDVQTTFTTLDSQYNLLRVACQTQAQRDALDAKYSAAQLAYQNCLGQMLADDDPAVATLSAQLKTINTQLTSDVSVMGEMNKVIDNITTAVTLGAQILAMA